MESNIKLRHNSKIDLTEWDNLIANSTNSRIYAYSWFLDIIYPDWYGIIYGNYQYIMPIIVAKKFGISYCFQPTYAQQHGIFPPSTPDITDEIISFLKQSSQYVDISLNSMNIIHDKHLTIEERKNHLLSLKPEYSEIRKGYNSHAKRYSNYAHKHCNIVNDVTINQYLEFKRKNATTFFSEENSRKLQLIMSKTTTNGQGIILGAYSERNELIATAFFLIDRHRFIYLNSVSSSEGKKARAMYAIIDSFINEHSESNMLLDFEGSSIAGIARFFSGFGAVPETYQHIKYNKLPWLIRLLKK